jgi:hypothetical protein
MQRREPNPYSKEMIQSYARFVAHLKVQETGKTVTGVKVYRVIHNLPTAMEIARGIDPAEKHFYYPYYQGEFTADGTLKNPQDPYLYWLIPIVKTRDVAAFRAGILRPFDPAQEDNLEIIDLLEEHAQLTTESTTNPKLDPIPGGSDTQPAQKSAATAPAPLTIPR